MLMFSVEQFVHPDGTFTVKPRRLVDGREIGVNAAARMLGFKDRESVYRLIALGDLKAWKPASERGNGKWRIDWQSCADYKAGRQAAARRGEG